mmetsp:Transcript_112303/g.362692  ORF Transcript_112303/g.362692 Transcript_112303/m.362692 type:complete len:245 (+) Transcript_112303:121-855(+)
MCRSLCARQLPWQGIQADTKEEKYRKIMECKRSTPVESLCKGYPAVFVSYLNYCRALRFEDRPDYAYLRRLFKDLFMREGFVNDGLFDWSQPGNSLEKSASRSSGSGAVGELPRASTAGATAAASAAAAPEEPRPLVSLDEPAPPATVPLPPAPPAPPGAPDRPGQAETTEAVPKGAAGANGREDPRKSPTQSTQEGGDSASAAKNKPTAAASQPVVEERPAARRKPGLVASIFGCWSKKAVEE